MLRTEARREQILRTLQTQQRVRVSRLAQHFGVSTVTIRSDLRVMTQAGLLARQHGGARLAGQPLPEAPLAEKRILNRERKLRIAARAAQLVAQSDNLIVDAGSTTLMLARHLPAHVPLTVFTNSLPIASELGPVAGLRLMVSGGSLRQASQSLLGPHAEASLQSFLFDKLFLGADGCDPAFGLTTHDSDDARLSACMVDHARQVIVLADGSKFGQVCLHRICSLERIDVVVSDSSMPPAMRAALAACDIKVIIAEEN
jgi:DeoR/GlpR family transcriptional regulator of sugar metabolism